MKKGDISLNYIVYGAIALLVLVLIIAFATGAFGNLFKGIKTAGTGELEATKNKCIQECNTAKTLVQGGTKFSGTPYCTTKYPYDKSGNGQYESTEYFNCWNADIGVTCKISATCLVAKAGTEALDCKPDSSRC